MMAIARATWQSSNFWIVDPELLCTQITEDGCSEQYLRWQLRIPWILPLHPTKLTNWSTGMMSSLSGIMPSSSEGWTVWWYDRMSLNSRFNYSIIRWFYHFVIRIIVSFDHAIFRLIDFSIIRSSIIRLSYYSSIQSLNHLIIQSLIYYSFDYWIFQSWRHEYQLSFIMR